MPIAFSVVTTRVARCAMEFRWIAAIALWTVLIGPIVGVPSGSASRSAGNPVKEVKAKTVRAPQR
jgi:hypothetical protein